MSDKQERVQAERDISTDRGIGNGRARQDLWVKRYKVGIGEVSGDAACQMYIVGPRKSTRPLTSAR